MDMEYKLQKIQTKPDDDSEYLNKLQDFDQYQKYTKVQNDINFLNKKITDKMADERTEISLKLTQLRFNRRPDIWKPDKFSITTMKGPKIEIR